MTQIHFCFRRINPALSVDLCTIGTLSGKEFCPLDPDQFSHLQDFLSSVGLPDFIQRSDISSEAYVFHGKVIDLLRAVNPDQIDWFQDTLILIVPVNLDNHESSKEEK